MKKVWISISSLTGNTRKLAGSLIREFREHGIEPEIHDIKDDGPAKEIPPADLIILCFWCRRAGMDDLTKSCVDRMSGRQVLAFGTMGSYTEGSYADSVRENVRAYISRDNLLKGLFLCRGKIAEEKTEKRRSLPKDHPHYLNDAGYERHLSSRTHPDQKDLEDAAAFLRMQMNW